MYPGKISEQICDEIDGIHADAEPSHIIIDAGTNNLPTA